MTAKLLIVDDNPHNVLLLKSKLGHEFGTIYVANNGKEGIELAQEHSPDLIFMDVVMPGGCDGIETCKELKSNPTTMHIPILIVSALDEREERVAGLEAGADDFINLPLDDIILFARVRALLRSKVLADELRLRGETIAELLKKDSAAPNAVSSWHAHILIVEDDLGQAKRLKEMMSERYHVDIAASLKEAHDILHANPDYNLVLASYYMRDGDGLRLAYNMRRLERTRRIPLIMMLGQHNAQAMLKGLEIGVNDFILAPMDGKELLARVNTQVHRARYEQALVATYRKAEAGMEDAEKLRDPVTGLYGKEYLKTHLKHQIQHAKDDKKSVSLVLVDIVRMRQLNEELGAAGGDLVLRELAGRIIRSLRVSDMVLRYEEDMFAIILPDTEAFLGSVVMERIAYTSSEISVSIAGKKQYVEMQLKIGHTSLMPEDVTGDAEQHVEKLLEAAKENMTKNHAEAA